MAKELSIDIFNPVHFHGALILQSMYREITGLELSPIVRVYHSNKNTLAAFKGMAEKIKAEEQGWKIGYFASDSPLENMLKNKGDILVLACPNVNKMDVISRAVQVGYDLILSDKPWIIEAKKMFTLEKAIERAAENHTILYDIMTERYELGTIMQGLIMQNEDLFGVLEKGSVDQPAITKKSIHILDKSHMGVVRPPEYFDTNWQGEGIVDVTTHLVDMTNILVRPNREVYSDDVKLHRAKRWATRVPQTDFGNITKTRNRSPIFVYCNGSLNYELDNSHAYIEVVWNLKGKDDEHYSTIEGSKVTIEVVKGPEDKHQQVYITPNVPESEVKSALEQHVANLREQFNNPGIGYKKERKRFKLVLPENMYTNHFQHFAEVATQALRYLSGKQTFPRSLEDSRLYTKYHLTTSALEIARKAK